MIWVNCYIPRGLTIHEQLQHTSFLKVIRSILGLPNEPLTLRDAAAPTVNLTAIFGNVCRELPEVTPRTDPNPPENITARQSQFYSPVFQAILAQFTPVLEELGIPLPTP